MNEPKPLVSVLINNYNYARFLREAIDSALNQSYPNIEVIVVDDGSTDESREIIASYGDQIVPVLKENGGQASAFNSGFAKSRGEWILFLDSDDIFAPEKAGEVVRLAGENPEAGMIAHSLEYCGADGAPTHFLPLTIKNYKLVDDRERVLQGKITAALPATSGLCMRRDVLARILPMPEEIRLTADNYLKFVALSVTPALQIPESLARQRIHDRNLYTGARADPDQSALLKRIRVSSQIAFHLKRMHPGLARLVWKQYGRVLHQLARSRTEEASAVKADIKSRYNVLEWSPECFFYVGGAYTKAFLRHILRTRSNA